MTSTDDLEALAQAIADVMNGGELRQRYFDQAHAVLASDWLRARDERNWDAGHNHCFHVDPPKSAGNPHRVKQ